MAEAKLNTSMLIQAVEKYPLLWDLNSLEYKNPRKKDQAWRDIGLELGISDALCKKKWKGLRSSYSRELSKRNRSCRDAKEDFELSWKYGTQMDFLREHVKGRSTLVNQLSYSEKTCAPSPSQNFEHMFFENPMSPHSDCIDDNPNISMQNHRIEDTFQQSFLNTLKSALQPLQSTPADPDEDDLFCKSIIKQIKRFPTKEKNQCKLQILSFVAEVENSLIESGDRNELKFDATEN